MVNTNFQEVELNHLVIFEKDSTVFAAGRERATNHIRIFLINERTGNTYSRNGRTDSWEEIFGTSRQTVVDNIIYARNNRTIPVYSVNDRIYAGLG